MLTLVPQVWAEESGGLDWSSWQRLPVLQDGRIMPLDSFARAQVKKICGDVHPNIGKIGALTTAEMEKLSPDERQRLRPRRFLAAELVYAWIVDPDNWDEVPFILADDAELRSKVLDLPLVDADGNPLTHVSPKQIRLARKFARINQDIEVKLEQAQKTKKKPEFTAIEEKVRSLDEDRQLFLQFGYDPGLEKTSDPWWLMNDFVNLRKSWDKFVESLTQNSSLGEPPDNLRVPEANEHAQNSQRELFQVAERTEQAIRELTTQMGTVQSGAKPIRSLEPAVLALRELTSELDAKMQALAASELPDRTNLIVDNTESIESSRQSFSRWTRSMAMQAAQIPWDLYSAGEEAVSVVPAMEATALEADRYRSEIRPWMSLQALLRGSRALLHDYPAEDVRKIRSAWKSARDAYLDRGDAETAQKFAASMQLFSTGIRGLSEAIEPGRRELPVKETDRRLLAKTTYPAAVATDAEVLYNRVDPFRWSGYSSLLAACILGLSCLARTKLSLKTGGLLLGGSLCTTAIASLFPVSFPSFLLVEIMLVANLAGICGIAIAVVLPLHKLLLRTEQIERTYRNVTFWLGAATLVIAVAFIAGGFVLRMYITRWAPVTSMFETIVWVTMSAAIFTLWVTFLPLLGPTSKRAWGLTAIPGSWEDKSQQDSNRDDKRVDSNLAGPPQSTQAGIRTAALAMRFVLFTAGVFVGLSYMGVFDPDPSGTASRFHLEAILPRADLGSSMPNLSASLVWAASMFVASAFVWYLPRLIPSALLAIPMSLALARRKEAEERMEKVYRTRGVPLAGAVACFCAAMAANYAPFPKDIQALMPVLRSNFWLGIHVLTITTSYAAVFVAWVIGNVALGVFAFGRYRTVDGEPRPPAFCGTLAAMNYRVLQVAVLLITAGTILGGLWADVSWGRFWGWDPKEVGALIALLIIMTALHGRRAGWHGDLSLAIGSVWGFAGVMWAWYVVNFILNAGKHAYATGEGGQWLWLIAVVAIQSLYIAAALARVTIETRRPAEIT
jgi:hypothetical protein